MRNEPRPDTRRPVSRHRFAARTVAVEIHVDPPRVRSPDGELCALSSLPFADVRSQPVVEPEMVSLVVEINVKLESSEPPLAGSWRIAAELKFDLCAEYIPGSL